MQYKKQTHCVYVCQYHIVLPTKYRKKIFNPGVFAYIKDKLSEIGKHYPEIEIVKVNADKDHIHMLISIPPKMSVGSVVRIIKSNTSRGLKDKFLFLKEVYWGTDGIWSDGYFVSTIGINEEVVKRYIENQGKEDIGRSQIEL